MKYARKNHNSQLLELLGEKPIVFNRCLAQLADSAEAGLFLSQLLYWSGKGVCKGWVYKTIKDYQEETHLNRSEQDRAIKIWKELGVLQVELKGLPRKRYFHIHEDKLLKLLERTKRPTSLLESTNQFAQTSTSDWPFGHAITESTSKNTNKDLSLQEYRPTFLKNKNAGRADNEHGTLS